VMQRHGELILAETDKATLAPIQIASLGPVALPAPARVKPPAATAMQAILTYPRTLALEVGRGDTLVGMLIRNKVPEPEAHKVVDALDDKFDPNRLRVGQKISVTLDRHEKLGDATAVKELAIRLPNLSTIELQQLTDGHYNVAATQEKLASQPYHAVGVVKSSISQAAANAGVPMKVLNELIKAYSYDIDFQREIHPGDRIEVLMERKVSKEGHVGGYGEARYAVLTLSGRRHEIYRFKDGYGDVAWYDGKGNAVKKSLLRTPLNAAHITSGFGMREHPILGYTKFHRGVDFGATQGTPIMAAGNGVVEQKGWVNGYGNFVLIRHNGTYETAYGHCSRFANIRVGERVKQGQVIAYVGMTGMATGPHLHYEVRQNSAQVNPTAKQFNLASGLAGKQLAAFKSLKQGVTRDITLADKVVPSQQLASR
jgi:murein DD-endopeptidase MepM/ murein hydrolase activator NlpD